MKKEFTANILFLIAINLVIKPFYALAIDTSVQNEVGAESYGIYLALFNFVYIQQIFADLGVQNYNNRKISRNPALLKEQLPKILGSKLLFTLLFAIIVILTSFIFNYDQYINEILVWIISTQASLSFLLYCRTNISGVGKYFADSIFSVIDKLVLIFILGYFLWLSPPAEGFSIVLFVKAQFVSIALTLMLCLLYINSQINRISISIDLTFARQLLRKSLPYATLVLLMAGYSRMDGIMLEQLMNDNALEAGKYASSFRLYDTFNNFTFLFAVLLLPMFSRMIPDKEPVDDLVKWAFSLLSLASIFVIILSIFNGEAILDYFYDRNIDPSYVNSLIFLMLAGLPLSLNYIYGSLLTANGSMKLLNTIALVGFVINLVLNLIMIPLHGAPGAAFATLITQLVVLIFQMWHSQRIFSLKTQTFLVFKLLLISALIVGVFYLLNNTVYLGLGLVIFFAAAFYIIVAFLLKLITLEDLRFIAVIKD